MTLRKALYFVKRGKGYLSYKKITMKSKQCKHERQVLRHGSYGGRTDMYKSCEDCGLCFE